MRRTVVVGARLRPGHTMDEAVHRVETLIFGSTLCLAVLDRPDGTTVLAVTLEGGPVDEAAHHTLLAPEMATMFDSVSLVESPSETLATTV